MKPTDEADAPRELGRREALAKLGKLAKWTTPVLLTLTLSERASAESQTPTAPDWPPPTDGAAPDRPPTEGTPPDKARTPKASPDWISTSEPPPD